MDNGRWTPRNVWFWDVHQGTRVFGGSAANGVSPCLTRRAYWVQATYCAMFRPMLDLKHIWMMFCTNPCLEGTWRNHHLKIDKIGVAHGFFFFFPMVNTWCNHDTSCPRVAGTSRVTPRRTQSPSHGERNEVQTPRSRAAVATLRATGAQWMLGTIWI